MQWANADTLDMVHYMAQRWAESGVPILLLLAMVVIPLPPLALDVLFTFNIALSLVVMLVVVYTLRPLEFSVFPSLLLVDDDLAHRTMLKANLTGAGYTVIEAEDGDEVLPLLERL